MLRTHVPESNSLVLPDLLSSRGQPCWFAAYTCANHEKSVARQLHLRAFEYFLPLYEKMSRWKDRRVKLQLPLFTGYVFVHMTLEQKLDVLQIPSVVRLVGFNGIPTPLSDGEMEAMRKGLSGALHVEPFPYLRVGRRVLLRSGPLQGLQGILLKKKSGSRFVLSLDLIQRSIAVEVDSADVTAVS
jgi:transcription antitermination factor NusG